MNLMFNWKDIFINVAINNIDYIIWWRFATFYINKVNSLLSNSVDCKENFLKPRPSVSQSKWVFFDVFFNERNCKENPSLNKFLVNNLMIWNWSDFLFEGEMKNCYELKSFFYFMIWAPSFKCCDCLCCSDEISVLLSL